MDGATVAVKQLFKDSEKLPGYVYLFVLTFAAIEAFDPPTPIRRVPLSPEILAAALTALLYAFGDALDEFVFKTGPEEDRKTREKYKQMYKTEQEAASAGLGVGNGLYSVALKLVAAGVKDLGKLSIHWPNEFAKCLRALILPLPLMAIVFYFQGRTSNTIVCLAGAAVLLWLYPLLKVHHIRLLYSAASKLTSKSRYHDELLGPMRLVFWDGSFVGAGDWVPKVGRPVIAHQPRTGD